MGTKGKASYWYAYRKEGGKLAKCYIGTALDLTVSNLEAISSKLTEKLQTKVAEKIPVIQSQVTEKLPVTNSEVEKLQKQMEELQRQLQITLGKVDSLEAELEASRLEEKTVHPDYQAIRNGILQNWRVSKRTESKDRIAQALDAFIAELTTDGESPTPASIQASVQASVQNETTAPLVDKPRLDSEVVKQSAQIRLWLRVENNNKFIRRKKKVREHIERFCLSQYDAQKTTPNSHEYILTIPYENDEDLDKLVYDLFGEMDSHADMDYCFIEIDAHEIGTDRSW